MEAGLKALPIVTSPGAGTVKVALASVAFSPLLVVKAPMGSVFRWLPAVAVTSTVTVQTPGVVLLPPGIVPPVKVSVELPAVAESTPPQVLVALGEASIVTPLGKVSVNAAPVAGLVLALLKVMVRVETPPAPMVAGSNALANVGVVMGDAPAQPPLVMWLSSSVTSPFRAKALPNTFAPVCSAMSVSATIFPTKSALVPIVAELPTCQYTLQKLPPLIMRTVEPLWIVSADGTWKMNSAVGSPWASRVRVPLTANRAADVKQ